MYSASLLVPVRRHGQRQLDVGLFGQLLGFALIGASAGVVQIAQLAYLARTGEPQGVVVGVFTTGSYAGMTVLPVLAALVAEYFGYAAAFGLIVLISLSVAVTIERCHICRLPVTGANTAP